MVGQRPRMPTDTGAAREAQELLDLFDEAQAAGAVLVVVGAGARDELLPPPSCDAAPSAPCEEDEDLVLLARVSPGRRATQSPAESVVLTRSRQGKSFLTAEDALRIFQAREQRSGNKRHLAAQLAQEAGVHARTVRDIWNLRTWAETTRPCWSPADCKRHAAGRDKIPRQQPPPRSTAMVPENEGFDLIPRAVDGAWKLHAAWLAAPAEKRSQKYQ